MHDLVKLTWSRKTIGIQPRTLLPTGRHGMSIGTKRVDYAMGFDLSHPTRTRSYLKSLDQDYPSLNQCEHPMICDRGLFSALEIKKDSSGRDGQIQMGIWCAAGFKKTLCLMRERQGHINTGSSAEQFYDQPIVPLWLVEDATWRLYVGSQDTSDEVLIGGPLLQWSTDTPCEIVTLILSLTATMEWGVEQYLPWFCESIGFER